MAEVERGFFALLAAEREVEQQIRREKRRLGLYGICEICQREAEVVQDHDHLNGMCRGKLCHRCNNGLGIFQDDDQRLERAADYLRRYRVVHYKKQGRKYTEWLRELTLRSKRIREQTRPRQAASVKAGSE